MINILGDAIGGVFRDISLLIGGLFLIIIILVVAPLLRSTVPASAPLPSGVYEEEVSEAAREIVHLRHTGRGHVAQLQELAQRVVQADDELQQTRFPVMVLRIAGTLEQIYEDREFGNDEQMSRLKEERDQLFTLGSEAQSAETKAEIGTVLGVVLDSIQNINRARVLIAQ